MSFVRFFCCRKFLSEEINTVKGTEKQEGWSPCKAINITWIPSERHSSKPDFHLLGDTNPHPCQDTQRSTSRKANMKILQGLQAKVTSMQEIPAFLIPPAKLFLKLFQQRIKEGSSDRWLLLAQAGTRLRQGHWRRIRITETYFRICLHPHFFFLFNLLLPWQGPVLDKISCIFRAHLYQ